MTVVKPPNRNLPPDAVPWARWTEDNIKAQDSARTKQAQSIQNSFKSINGSLSSLSRTVAAQSTLFQVQTGYEIAPVTMTGSWASLAPATLVVPSGFTRVVVTISSTVTAGVASFSGGVSGTVDVNQQIGNTVLVGGTSAPIDNAVSPVNNGASLSLTQSLTLTGLSAGDNIGAFVLVRADPHFNVMVSNNVTAFFYN